jgi:hypothetical protein
VVIFLDNEHHMRAMITTEKKKEGDKEHFTDGVSSGGGEEAEAAVLRECGARARGEACAWRKGEDEGDA